MAGDVGKHFRLFRFMAFFICILAKQCRKASEERLVCLNNTACLVQVNGLFDRGKRLV